MRGVHGRSVGPLCAAHPARQAARRRGPPGRHIEGAIGTRGARVKWVGFALVNAEELGIGQGAVAEALASGKPDVRRFTGAEGDFGRKLGLDNAWAIRAVKAVGHYGEVFERNIGARSRLGIPRGLNQLWSAGGIIYAPPIR